MTLDRGSRESGKMPRPPDASDLKAALKRTVVNLVGLSEVYKKKAFLIADANTPREKKQITAALARAVAQEGRRTLLITESGNLRQSGPDSAHDYKALLKSGRNVAEMEACLPDLFLVRIAHSSDIELFNEIRTTQFLNLARANFDFVFVDITCLHDNPLALFLVSHVDGVILLVRPETSKDSALMAKRKIEEARGELVGAITSRMTSPIPPAVMRRWNLY